jgi:hypothetical protein
MDEELPVPPNLFGLGRDPKNALTMLKRSLLTRHAALKLNSTSEITDPVEKRSEYIDRAARRRLLHPEPRLDHTPGVFAPPPKPTFNTGFVTPMTEEGIQPMVSQPPTPLPPSNVGHRLLLQQGWAPGNALGMLPDIPENRAGLVDPLEIKSTQNRAGLGMKQPTATDASSSSLGLNWREREKFKRFGDLR